MTSLAPIPVATLANREVGSMGQNYLKSLFAVSFQGLLIAVRRHLCGAGAEHRHHGRSHRSHLELRGIYGATGLYAVQNRVDCEKHMVGSINTGCEICATNMTECIGVEPEPEIVETTEPVAEPDMEKGRSGTFLLIVVFVLIGGAAAWYFKIYLPKKDI